MTARLAGLLFLVLFRSELAGQSIQGVVTEALEGHPVAGVRIELRGTRFVSSTRQDGRYEVAGVPSGTYWVKARAVGFRADSLRVNARPGELARADFVLMPIPTPLADVIVTPSRTGVALEDGTSYVAVSGEALATFPQLGEDLYRAITRVPGMATHDYSARFWLRGGPERELLTRYDGMDLIEPFHLKDFDGALSIVDASTIGRLELSSGGFTSEYGDRLTGVLAMETRRPAPASARYGVGLSLTSARVSGQGRFAGGNGGWLVAARRGYLDIGLKLIGNDNDLSPRYYDLAARTEYQFGRNHALSFQLLRAGDALTFTDVWGRELESRYRSTFAWAGWQARVRPALTAATTISLAVLSWNRTGGLPGSYQVEDDRHATLAGIRQDWRLGLEERVLLKWGFDLKRVAARYDYRRQQRVTQFERALRPDGGVVGAYLAARFRPLRPVTLEAGGRFDSHTYLDSRTITPRLNAALDLGHSTTLRAAWGWYAQAPGIHEISVQDGEPEFLPDASERAVQRIIGLERTFPSGVAMRVEAYDRSYLQLNRLWINLTNGTAVFPEAEFDRYHLDRRRGRARGVEFLVQQGGGRKLDWAVSYALAKADDEAAIDKIRSIPRVRDQRHTVYLDLSYAPSSQWRLAGSWQFHTGWPYTERSIVVSGSHEAVGPFVPAQLNRARLPAYHRLDVRITRYVPLGRRQLAIFVDGFNLYGRANVRGYQYDTAVEHGRTIVRKTPDKQLPFLPSIGVSLEF